MRAAIITVVILLGVAEAYGQTVPPAYPTTEGAAYPTTEGVAYPTTEGAAYPTTEGAAYVEGSVVAPVVRAGHLNTATGKTCLGDWFGPMPQTCYQPRFGCYPGNPRTIHRYPAFHGYYYRAPYNYRHYFEYPWHAAPHEPQAFASGGAAVVEESIVPLPDPSLHAE
ncbi:MAG: hypothetical protein GYA33_01175 [Thermogutta sp.]|nr:hypothetical protein [Thermogutta sp.]